MSRRPWRLTTAYVQSGISVELHCASIDRPVVQSWTARLLLVGCCELHVAPPATLTRPVTALCTLCVAMSVRMHQQQRAAAAWGPACSCNRGTKQLVVLAQRNAGGGARRRVPALAVAAAARTATKQVAVDITNTSMTSRKINACIAIAAPVEVVWTALTDYDNLGTFIPGLVQNRCLERSRGGCKLYQQSAQDVALGVKFSAGVTLDIQEYPAGLPAHLCAEEGVHDYSRAFPCPNSFTLQGQSYSDISFALLEGDFAAFKGVWRLQNAPEDPDGMQLNYSVYVKPMPFLPVGLIQNRIEKEIVTNLKAVQRHAEKLHSRQRSSFESDRSSMTTYSSFNSSSSSSSATGSGMSSLSASMDE